MRKTFAAIRRANPKTRIAYVAYPDYSAATAWQERGSAATLALGVGLGLAARRRALSRAGRGRRHARRDRLPTRAASTRCSPTILSTSAPQGHSFYAERIAASLTG